MPSATGIFSKHWKLLGALFSLIPVKGPPGADKNTQAVGMTGNRLLTVPSASRKSLSHLTAKKMKSVFLSSHPGRTAPCCKHLFPSGFCKINNTNVESRSINQDITLSFFNIKPLHYLKQ